MKEQWKDIEGYNGDYQVSDNGRIKSLKTNRHKIMKCKNHKSGHLLVSLSKDKKSKWIRVHRIVATAFIENPENYKLVLHKDDNPENNKASNLYWGTYTDNYKDRVLNSGHGNEGENHGMSTLTNQLVIEIRNTHNIGCFTYQEIADAYNISLTCAWNLIKRQSWNHI